MPAKKCERLGFQHIRDYAIVGSQGDENRMKQETNNYCHYGTACFTRGQSPRRRALSLALQRLVQCTRSLLFGFCFLALLCLASGCSAPTDSAPSSPNRRFADASLQVRAALRHYGEVQLPALTSYLGDINQKLVQTYLSIHTKDGSLDTRAAHLRTLPLTIKVLATDEPIALTAGNGITLVSTGILQSLQSEDELAFVLAHELAHLWLAHPLPPLQTEQTFRQEFLHRYELEADTTGLQVMSRAGFSPMAGPQALLRVHQKTFSRFNDKALPNPEASTGSHPSLSARLQALYAFVPLVPPRYFHQKFDTRFSNMQGTVRQYMRGNRK